MQLWALDTAFYLTCTPHILTATSVAAQSPVPCSLPSQLTGEHGTQLGLHPDNPGRLRWHIWWVWIARKGFCQIVVGHHISSASRICQMALQAACNARKAHNTTQYSIRTVGTANIPHSLLGRHLQHNTDCAARAARDNSQQWLLGDALLVSPVLAQNASSVAAYFPPGTWYSFYGGSAIEAPAQGATITLQVKIAAYAYAS